MKTTSGKSAIANGVGLIAIATVATVVIAGGLISNDRFREFLRQLADFSDNNLPMAAMVYVLVQALVVVVLFPGLIFTLLAGYLFGPVLGTAVMVTGTVIGASTAFLIARFVFKQKFSQLLDRYPQFAVIAHSVADDGWKTVMLTRTIPLFPFKLSNYCFGVVPVSLAHFALGTALGIIPLTVANVSVGALAADLDSLLGGNPSLGIGQYLAIGIGIVGGVATFMLVRKRAQARFKQLESERASGAETPRFEGSHG